VEYKLHEAKLFWCDNGQYTPQYQILNKIRLAVSKMKDAVDHPIMRKFYVLCKREA
jgi:hypothetical protein